MERNLRWPEPGMRRRFPAALGPEVSSPAPDKPADIQFAVAEPDTIQVDVLAGEETPGVNFTILAVEEPEEGAVGALETEDEEGEEAKGKGNQEGKGKKDKDKGSKGKKEGGEEG